VEFASSVVVLTAFKVSVMPSGVFGTTLPLPSTAPLNESFRWSNRYLKYPLGSFVAADSDSLVTWNAYYAVREQLLRWALVPPFLFALAAALSSNAAALILARCRTENPPELVAQSTPGYALQNGQTNAVASTGRTSGIRTSVPAMLRACAGSHHSDGRSGSTSSGRLFRTFPTSRITFHIPEARCSVLTSI